MKLTEQEIQFFKDLSSSTAGQFLLSYMKRVQDHVFDSRSWKEGDTKESAAHASRLLEELVIDKIKPKTSSGQGASHYE